MATARQNSSASSALKVPSVSRGTSAFHTQYGLPLTSTATVTRVSSIGSVASP